MASVELIHCSSISTEGAEKHFIKTSEVDIDKRRTKIEIFGEYSPAVGVAPRRIQTYEDDEKDG